MTSPQFISHLKFLRERPLVGLRIVKNILYSFFLKKPRMKNLELAITYRCNHKCKMCSATTLHDNKKHLLRVEKILDVIEQCKKIGLVHVDLTGGEPFLRPWNELLDIVKGITRKKDMIVAIATNGSLVTEEKLTELHKAGLTQILFNLQSSDLSIHDRWVGEKGSYKKVIKGIKTAKRLGYTICVNTVLGKYNFDDIVKLGDICKKLGVFLAINLAASAGKWKNDKSKKLTIDWYEKYSEFMKKTHVRTDNIINFRTFKWGCPGGIEKWYITPYGEVIQCPFVQISYGNILKESVKNIFRKITNFYFISRYTEFCKNVFWDEFKEAWLNPLDDFHKLPIFYKKHPNFEKYKKRSARY